MLRFARCAAVLLGLQLLCPIAGAVVLTIDPIQSTVVVEIVALGGCPSCDVIDTLAFSGTINVSVLLSEDPTEGTVVGSMQIASSDLALTDGAWLVPAGFVLLEVDTVGVGGTMASPFTVGIPVLPQTSEFELQGSMLTLNEGILTGFVEGLADVTHQLGVDPMSFSFDSTTVATATVTNNLPDLYDVEVTIPISLATMYESLTVEMEGTIVMMGVVRGPAPIPSLSSTGAVAVIVLLMASSIAAIIRTHPEPSRPLAKGTQLHRRSLQSERRR
jgi:hypothetical protein